MCEHHNDAWTPGRKGEENQERRSNETAEKKTRLRHKNDPGREAGRRDRWEKGELVFLSEEVQLRR